MIKRLALFGAFFCAGAAAAQEAAVPAVSLRGFANVQRTDFPDWLQPLSGNRETESLAGVQATGEQAWANGASLSITGQADVDDGGDTGLSLRNLRLAYDGAFSAELGYATLGWSFFDLVHPLDPVELQAFYIDTEDPTVSYALPYGQLSFYGGSGAVTRLVATTIEQDLRDDRRDDHVFGIRHERYIGNGHVAVQALAGPSDSRRIGLSGNLASGAMIWVAEGEYVADTTLPMAGAEDGARVVLGGRHALGQGAQIDFGYYYNGLGLGDAAWDRLQDDLDASSAAIADHGNYAGAGLMGAFAEASETRFLRRNYLFASYSSVDRFDRWDITAGLYLAADDGSAFGFAELTYSLSERAAIRLNPAIGIGPGDSEFGRRPSSLSALFTYTFGRGGRV